MKREVEPGRSSSEPHRPGVISRFLGDDHRRLDALLAQLKAAPDVPASPCTDDPKVLVATRRALASAGYSESLFDD
jgi:hypothetical protein